jgi:hypothetical protein
MNNLITLLPELIWHKTELVLEIKPEFVARALSISQEQFKQQLTERKYKLEPMHLAGGGFTSALIDQLEEGLFFVWEKVHL